MTRAVRILLAAVALAASVPAVYASPAVADFGIAPGSFFAKAYAPVTTSPAVVGVGVGDENNGTVAGAQQWTQAIAAAPSLTQAGSHPDVSTSFAFKTRTDSSGNVVPDGNPKDLVVDLPPGLVGDPQATPICSREDFLGTLGPAGLCPVTSQVGVAVLSYLPPGHASRGAIIPVYNIAPTPGKPASFGFKVPQVNGVPVILDASLRSDGDYGLRVGSTDLSTQALVFSTTVTIWGVPADPVHDLQRWLPVLTTGGELGGSWGASVSGFEASTPFLTYPTDCDSGPLTATLSADSWQNPGAFVSASAALPTPTGCDRLSFGGPGAPVSLTAQPDVSAADTPAGYDVKLRMPYNTDPNGLATPTLRNAVVTLPPGVTVNPAAANGLGSCSPEQIGLHSLAPASCPDSSKLGTVQVTTPLLPDPLTGSVYQAAQGDNPFGTLLALYIVAEGDGVTVKLAGRVDADPHTGRLTTTLTDNPQLPFTEFDLSFFGGPLAPLVNSPGCGSATTTSVLTPWSAPESGPPLTSQTSFAIDQNCAAAQGFSPSLDAGVVNPQAGRSSAFTLTLSRDSGENVSGLDVTLPPGLLAKLAGVPLCPEAQAAPGDCPSSSQVGSTTVAAGPGPSPLYIPHPGKAPTAVYLAGPYTGAPYSLVIKVPAQAGPFDLGTVAVRAALFVDPTDAHVTVKSDPLPQILQGIPLEYRKINVTIDRPGFMQSPTSCNPMQISADVTSAPLGGPVSVNARSAGFSTAAGPTAKLSSRFQVGGCQALGFSPKLKIALSGKGKTHSGNHPTLTATLTDPSGQANIRSAKVALPLSMALDVNNSKNVCAFATAQAVHGGAVGCPASTIVGQATAQTPLLSQPLTGPVYLVQGIRFGKNGQPIHTLPSLLIPLRGQIALDLRAQSAVSGGKLVTTFSTIPDAPVSKFTLKINGGRKGLLVITGRGKTICGKKQVSNATFGAQSGKSMSRKVTMGTPCPKAKHKAKKHGKKGKARSAKHALRTPVVDRLW